MHWKNFNVIEGGAYKRVFEKEEERNRGHPRFQTICSYTTGATWQWLGEVCRVSGAHAYQELLVQGSAAAAASHSA